MAMKKIADGLHQVSRQNANTFLLDTEDGLALIDTGWPGTGPTILQAIEALGRKPTDLRHILLTHAHIDHIGSLAALRAASGARTYMHPLDAPIAARGSGIRPLSPSPEFLGALLFRLLVKQDARFDPAPIDVLVETGETIPLAGGLTAIHVPGHCAGQLAYLWPSRRTLFAGDACANLLGLGLSICQEDLAESRRSLRKLAGLDFDIACFGHGGPIRDGAAARFRKVFG